MLFVSYLFHFKGRVDMKNVTFEDSKWLSIIPSGMYKVVLVTEDAETKLWNIQVTFEVKSSIKDSF